MGMPTHHAHPELLDIHASITNQDASPRTLTGTLVRLRNLTSAAAAGDAQLLEFLDALLASGIPDAVATSPSMLQDHLLSSCSCGLLRSWATAASTLPKHAQACSDQFQGLLSKCANNLMAIAERDGSDAATTPADLACLLQGMSSLIGVPISFQDKHEAQHPRQQHSSGTRGISRAGSPAGRFTEDSRATSSQRSISHRNGSQGRVKSQGRTARRFSTRAPGRSTTILDANALQPAALQAVCSAGLWQAALARIHTMIDLGARQWQDSGSSGPAQFLVYMCEMLAAVAQVHYDQQTQVQALVQPVYDTLTGSMCAALSRLAQDAGLQPAAPNGHHTSSVGMTSSDNNCSSSSSSMGHLVTGRSYPWLCAWAAELAALLTALHKLIIEENRWGCIATPLTARAVNASGCWTVISQLGDAMASSNLPPRTHHAPGQPSAPTPQGVAVDDETTASQVLAVQSGLTIALEPLAKLCHDLPLACSSCPEGSDLHQGLQQSVEQLADALLPAVLNPGLGAAAHSWQTASSLHTWVELLTDLVTACSEDWLKAMVVKCCKQVSVLAPSMSKVMQPGGAVAAQPTGALSAPFAPHLPAADALVHVPGPADVQLPVRTQSRDANGNAAVRPQAPEAAAAAGVGMAVFCLWTLERKGTLDYLLESHDFVQQLLKSAAQPPDSNIPNSSREPGGPPFNAGQDAGLNAHDAYGSTVCRPPIQDGMRELMAGMKRLGNRRLPTVISDVPMQDDYEDAQTGPASASSTDRSANNPDSVSDTSEDGLSPSFIVLARGCLHTAIKVLSAYDHSRQADTCSSHMSRDLACACAAFSAECLWELSGGPPEKGLVAGLAISRQPSGIPPGADSLFKLRSKAGVGPRSALSRQDSHVMMHRTSLLRHLNSSRRSLANSTSSAQLGPPSATHLSRPNSIRKHSSVLSGSLIGPGSILKHVRSDAVLGSSAPGRQVSFLHSGSRSGLARQGGTSGLLEDSFLLRLGEDDDADGQEGPSSRLLLTRAPGMRLETNTSLRSVKEAGDGEEEHAVQVPAAQLGPVGPPSTFFVNKRAARRKSACDLPPPRRASYVDFDVGEVSSGLSRTLIASASSTQQLVTSPRTDTHILEYLGSMLPLLGSWAASIDTTLKLCDYISLVAVELGLLQQQAVSRDSRTHSSYHAGHTHRLEQLLLATGRVIAHMLDTSSTLDLHQRDAIRTQQQAHLSKPHEKRFSCLYQSAGRALAVLQGLTGVEPDCTAADVVQPALNGLAAAGALTQLLHLSCQDVLLEDAAFQAHVGLMGWASQALLYSSTVQVVADCPSFLPAASQVYSRSWRHPKGHVLGRVLLKLQAEDLQVRSRLQEAGLASALSAQLIDLWQLSRGNSSLWPQKSLPASLGSQPVPQYSSAVLLESQKEARDTGGPAGLFRSSTTASSSQALISASKALLPLCLAFSLITNEQAIESQDMVSMAVLVAAGVLPACLDAATQQLVHSEGSSDTVAALCDITRSGVTGADEAGSGPESCTWVPLPHLISLVTHVVNCISTPPADPRCVSGALVLQAVNKLGDSLQALLQALRASSEPSVNGATANLRAAACRVQALADTLLANLMKLEL